MARKSIKAHPCRSFAIILAVFICSAVMIFMPLGNTISLIANFSYSMLQEHVMFVNADAAQVSGLFKDPHFESAIAVRHSRLGQAGGHYTRLPVSRLAGVPGRLRPG